MGVIDDLRRAREDYERREWVAAYRALSDLDDSALEAHDFTALATTAFLLGRRNDCVQALQRAHQSALNVGDVPAAVRARFDGIVDRIAVDRPAGIDADGWRSILSAFRG